MRNRWMVDRDGLRNWIVSRSRVAAFCLAICALTLPSRAAFDAFLSLEGIPGGSRDPQFKNWIEVESYEYGIRTEENGTTEAGVRSGKVKHFGLIIVKPVDIATPLLAAAVCAQTRIPKATLVLTQSIGNKDAFTTYTLQDVTITSLDQKGDIAGEEARPHETITLNYGQIKWIYNEEDLATGKSKAKVERGWNVITNRPVAVRIP